MYLLLILFFAALFGIITMIWRKLALLKSGEIQVMEEVSFEVPHIEKVKDVTVQKIKEYGHLTLVGTIRLYVRSTNLLKNKYNEMKTEIKNRIQGNQEEDKKEISKFLKTISEYKHKIRDIKQKIKEEEKKE